MLATQLSRVVLMVRPGDGMARALEFYTAGLGLEAARVTDEWAELRTTSRDKASNNSSTAPMSVCLQVVTSEAQVTTGYSPLLQFQLENMDDCIAKCVQLARRPFGWTHSVPCPWQSSCPTESRWTHDWSLRTGDMNSTMSRVCVSRMTSSLD